MYKQVISLGLVLVICASLSMTAFAAEPSITDEQTLDALFAIVSGFEDRGIEIEPYSVYLAELIIHYNELKEDDKIPFESFMVQAFTASVFSIEDEQIGEYIQGKWEELTEEEQALAIRYPTNLPIVASGKVYADGVAKNRYGRSGSGDESDAARHMSWNAFMTVELGVSRAKQWADAHEAKGGNYLTMMFTCGYNGNAHTHMDKYNNQVGRNIGETLTTIDDIPEAVYNAIDDGRAYTIHDHYNCMPV